MFASLLPTRPSGHALRKAIAAAPRSTVEPKTTMLLIRINATSCKGGLASLTKTDITSYAGIAPLGQFQKPGFENSRARQSDGRGTAALREFPAVRENQPTLVRGAPQDLGQSRGHGRHHAHE